MAKIFEKYDLTNIEKVGFTGWNGNSFRTYLIFGHFWLHINKHLRWPLISFMWLPF